MPVEDAEGPQRVPPAGAAVAVLKREVDFAGMCVLQQPGAIGLLFRSEQSDGFADSQVRLIGVG